MKKLLLGLALLPLFGLGAKADTFTYTGSTGGTWSVPGNWTDTASTGDAVLYPSTASDIANDGITTGSQTVVYDSGSTGLLGTLNLTNTGTGVNELDMQRTGFGITNATTIGSSTGTELFLIDGFLNGGNVTGGEAASTTAFTINAGGVVELDCSTNSSADSTTLKGAVTLQGGVINDDLSNNSGANQTFISGTFNMTSGTLNLSTTASNSGTYVPPGGYTSGSTRFYLGGNTAITGGVINNLFVNSGNATLWTNGVNGQTFYIGNSVTFSGSAPVIELAGAGTEYFYSSLTNLNTFTMRGGTAGTPSVDNVGAGTYTTSAAYTSNTLNIGNITYDHTASYLTFKLGSNVTLNAGSYLPTVDSGGLATAGNTEVNGIDTNGHTFDLTQVSTTSDSSGTFTPDAPSTIQYNGVTNVAYNNDTFNISDSGTGGVIKAIAFNLTGAQTSLVGGAGSGTYVQNVTGDTTLQSTGGNATANNLGNPSASGTSTFGTISATSTFAYTGTAASGVTGLTAPTESTVISNRIIGNLVVQNGALNINQAAFNTGGGVAISAGGTLDINAGSLGTLTLASGKNFSAVSSTLELTLNNAGLSDAIASAGGAASFSVTTATLSLNTPDSINYADSYTVLSGFTGTNTVSGVTITGYDTTDYTATLGNNGVLSFTAVPEPSTWVLMLGGLAFMAFCWPLRRMV